MKILTDPKAREKLRSAVRTLFAQNGSPVDEVYATPEVRMGRLQAYIMIRLEGFEAVKDRVEHLGVTDAQNAAQLVREVTSELAAIGYNEKGAA